MPLSRARKEQLARMMLPSDEDSVKRVRGFLLRSGLTISEFAEQIGYSYSAVGLFLRGQYDQHHPAAGNTLALRAACKEFIDLNEVNRDIRLRGTHYATEDYEAVRVSALTALRKGMAYIVDGPPGTQKSWSLLNIQRDIEDRKLGRCVYVYARVNHSPQSFLQECCVAAGIPNRGTIDSLLRKLQFFLARGRTLLLIDEAQHLDKAGLEVLRQLIDLPPYFGVVVAGSHDLTQRLQHWQMGQWQRRVQKTHSLQGPSAQESRAILAAQLGIVDKAEADAIIADCKARASRTVEKDGKYVAQQYEYISAGLLFGVIEGVLETTNNNLEAIA